MGASTMTDTPDSAPSEDYYPEFRTVRRGYDPDQVEQVLDDLYASLGDAARLAEQHATELRSAETARAKLTEALADAERRITELERHSGEGASPSFETLGSKIGEVLQAATAEAAEITRRAREEAQAIRNESEANAVTSRAEIDHYATDVRTQADDEANELVARARTEAERILADARTMREAQQRADLDAYERLAGEMAERRTRAETEFANEAAAHQRQLLALTARVDTLTDELSHERERATAEAEKLVAEARTEASTMIDEARRYRAKVGDQIGSAREQLLEVMSSVGMTVPAPSELPDDHADADEQVDQPPDDADDHTDEAGQVPASGDDPADHGADDTAAGTVEDRPSHPKRHRSGRLPWTRTAPPKAAAWSPDPADTDSMKSGARR
jgi:cell division septum initiation protein DivIVA